MKYILYTVILFCMSFANAETKHPHKVRQPAASQTKRYSAEVLKKKILDIAENTSVANGDTKIENAQALIHNQVLDYAQADKFVEKRYSSRLEGQNCGPMKRIKGRQSSLKKIKDISSASVFLTGMFFTGLWIYLLLVNEIKLAALRS